MWCWCFKWFRIRAAVKALEKAKLNAYNDSTAPETPKKPSRFKLCCKRVFCCCLQWKVKGTQTTALDYLCTAGTYANRIGTGLLRFFLALISVFLLLYFLKSKLSLSLSNAWLYLVGILVGLGVTFSQTVRVVLLLLAPQIFTQNVRFALMTNTNYVSLKGPGKNFVYNLNSLMEGLHKCKVDLEKSLRDALGFILNPLKIIIEFFKTAEFAIEAALKKLREAVDFVQSSLTLLDNVMHDAFAWLADITNMCNFQFGNPYERCKQEFQEAVSDCGEKLGETLSFMCHVDILDGLCEVTKVAESMCTLPSIIGENLFSLIRIELQEILDAWTLFFDARIHNVTFVPPKSKVTFSKNMHTFKQLKQEIFSSIEWLLRWPVTLQDLLTLGIAIVMVLSAINYLYWYLKSDLHDNYYITDGMIKMDIRRRMLGKQGIFPLTHSESKEYVQLWSYRKLKKEREKFKRQIFVVATSIIPAIIYVFIDMTLFSLLILFDELGESANYDVNFTGKINNSMELNATEDVVENPLPELSKRIKALIDFDLSDCAPTPTRPDFILDVIIGALLLFCIVSTAFEAYGLRLRHVICGYYYPERQQNRDRWLYTHILNSRGSFFKFAETQVMAKLTGDDHVFKTSCLQRFLHKCPGGRKLCWLLSINLKQCFLCGKSGGLDDYDNFQQCPQCQASYCNDCFGHLNRECPVCSNQIVYDFDIDEESGSSDTSDDSEISRAKKISQNLKKIREQKRPSIAETSYAKLSSHSHSSSPTSTASSPSPPPLSQLATSPSYNKEERLSQDSFSGSWYSSGKTDIAPRTESLQEYSSPNERKLIQKVYTDQPTLIPKVSSRYLPRQITRQPLSNNWSAGEVSFHNSINSIIPSTNGSPKSTKSFDSEESDDLLLGSAMHTSRTERKTQPEAIASESHGFQSFSSSSDTSHQSNINRTNSMLNDFWNFNCEGENVRPGSGSDSSEKAQTRRNMPMLSSGQMQKKVYSTFNDVLSDLSSSYQQFHVLSSDGSCDSIRYQMDSSNSEISYDYEGRPMGTKGRHDPFQSLNTSDGELVSGNDYYYNSCIPSEDHHVDDNVQMRYENVLSELTSDFPQFSIQSESSEEGFHSGMDQCD